MIYLAAITGRAHALVALTSLLIFVLTLVTVRKHREMAAHGVSWLAASFGLLLLGAFPGLLDSLSKWIGVQYPPTTVLLLAIGFLAAVLVRFSWEFVKLNRRTETLAEEVAFLRAELRHNRETNDAQQQPDDGQ